MSSKPIEIKRLKSVSAWPGHEDDILLTMPGNVMIKITVPLGHNADDVCVEISNGGGWQEVEVADR